MIKGGYYLKAKQIKNSAISKAAPCTRELWDYLLREASFTDTSKREKGQLIRSYQQIIEDLSWRVGNRPETYTDNQIKWGMSFLKKHEMITTKRQGGKILITICNYRYFQDWKNYEPTSQNLQDACKINPLKGSKTSEPTTEPPEPTSQTGANQPANQLRENVKIPLKSTISAPQEYSEPTGEPTTKTGANQPPLLEYTPEYNIYNNKYINNIKISIPDCHPGETEFERDRRLFLDSFPGVKTFQTFDDNQDRKTPELIKLVHVEKDLPVKYTLRLEELNTQGAGIYMAINETDGKGRKASNVVRVRSVFADLDGAPLEPVFEYSPSMIVESSPGKYHAYWFVVDDKASGVPLEGFRQLQECIAVKFGSDPKVKDLPRVLRVPGFYHNKKDPFLTRIIHWTGREHTFAYLSDLFPPAPRQAWSGEKYQKQYQCGDVEFKGQYGAPAGDRNNHLAKRAGGMIKRGLPWPEIENELWKEARACNPPLPEREVQEVIKSMRRYA